MKFKSLSLLLFSLLMGNAAFAIGTLTGSITETSEPLAFELTTTSSEFRLYWAVINGSSEIVQVEWGDESIEEWTVTGGMDSNIPHIYTDGKPSHDIKIYTAPTTFGSINLNNTQKFANIVSLNFVTPLTDLTELQISGNTGLTAISNLEYLPDLKMLMMGTNALETLNLSKNSALTTLSLGASSALTSLTLPTESVLEEIGDLTQSKLTSLDLSGQVKLKRLGYVGTTSAGITFNESLTGIDVSDCVALELVNVADNKLTSLDVSNSPALSTLNCARNELTSLIVNETATRVLCAGNKLTFASLPRLSMAQFGGDFTGYSPQSTDLLPITADGTIIDMSAICPDLSGEKVPGTASGGTGYNGYDVAWSGEAPGVGTGTFLELGISDMGGDPMIISNGYDFYTTIELLEDNYSSLSWVQATISHPAYPNLEFTTAQATPTNVPTGIEPSVNNDPVVDTEYYNLQGRKVNAPQSGAVYVAKNIHASGKVSVEKKFIND